MAASLAQIQADLEKTLKQVRAPSQELSSVNQKVDFFKTNHQAKDEFVDERRQANKQLANNASNNGSGEKLGDIKLIDMKVMKPKILDG